MATSKNSKNSKNMPAVTEDDWINADGLLLIEGWVRDGYTFGDIARRIGISENEFVKWRKAYPELAATLKNGRELINYKVENALLKAALGYKTKEVKVTTLLRGGKTVETTKEVLEKDTPPHYNSIRFWLINCTDGKWKNENKNAIDIADDDASINVTITRAETKLDNKEQVTKHKPKLEANAEYESTEDDEWLNALCNGEIESEEYEINKQITIEKRPKVKKGKKQSNITNKQELDIWPDDWDSL